MKKKIVIGGFLLILIVIILLNLKGFSKNELIGTYTNNYYEGIEKKILVPPVAPLIKDTLILNSDGTYKSKYSFGTYEIKQDILYLNKLYGSYGLTIRGGFLFISNKPKLLINPDGTYYYEKIK